MTDGHWRPFLGEGDTVHLIDPENFCLTCSTRTHPPRNTRVRANQRYEQTRGYRADLAFCRLLDAALSERPLEQAA